MPKYKVFLDSNVIISGLLSQKANPFLVLKAADEKKFIFYSGNFILAEIEKNLSEKAPQALPHFWIIWKKLNPKILELPSESEIEKFDRVINYLPDQVILSTCEKNKIDYLVTLDKKHLLKKEVQNETRVRIVRPEELLKKIN